LFFFQKERKRKKLIMQDFSLLIREVKDFLKNESSGHDFYHAERVFRNAEYIGSKEGGDLLVIGASALVHDICRPWEKETGKSHFGKEALKIIRNILIKAKIPKKNRGRS
jgi:HD superfamily phosphodiesterase